MFTLKTNRVKQLRFRLKQHTHSDSNPSHWYETRSHGKGVTCLSGKPWPRRMGALWFRMRMRSARRVTPAAVQRQS